MQQSETVREDPKRPKRHRVRNAAHGLQQGLKKAQAVTRTARRAARAPGHSMDDLKEATSSYTHSVTSAAGWYAGAGAVAAASFIVLTIGTVVGLNAAFGVPAGYFLTVLVYLIAAGIFVMVAKSRSTAHREEAEDHVQNVRDEIRHVERPIKQAFDSNNR